MQCAFDGNTVDNWDSGAQGLLSLLNGLLFDGTEDSLDGGLHFALVGTIAQVANLTLPRSLHC